MTKKYFRKKKSQLKLKRKLNRLVVGIEKWNLKENRYSDTQEEWLLYQFLLRDQLVQVNWKRKEVIWIF